jgi:hypothetical protein
MMMSRMSYRGRQPGGQQRVLQKRNMPFSCVRPALATRIHHPVLLSKHVGLQSQFPAAVI